MKKDPNCIFCKIVSSEIPSFKIAENEKFLAILDIAQFVEGHTIVIPKEHYEFFWDVPNVDEYFEFIKEVGNNFRKKGFKYVDTMTFGRSVNHAHVHLLPHNDDDDDWKKALKGIDDIKSDELGMLNGKKGKDLVKKFSFFID